MRPPREMKDVLKTKWLRRHAKKMLWRNAVTTKYEVDKLSRFLLVMKSIYFITQNKRNIASILKQQDQLASLIVIKKLLDTLFGPMLNLGVYLSRAEPLLGARLN